MGKFIEKSDLENKDLQILPIRRGCYGGPCACLGVCKNIEGYIDRKEYEEFIEKFVSLDRFLSEKCNRKNNIN